MQIIIKLKKCISVPFGFSKSVKRDTLFSSPFFHILRIFVSGSVP